jgi:V/A-type H+-transporting ATPase subunit E
MEDLQSLLEKINREGVEKAEKKAKEIIAEAEAKSAALLAESRLKAEKTVQDAIKESAQYSERAAETIRQASRDVVIESLGALTRSLEKVLFSSVSETLEDGETLKSLVSGLLKSLASGGEITASEKTAKLLASELAGKGEFKVVTDETLGAGFTVRVDGGRIEHSFTAETFAAEIAKRLRPDLAKIVK